MKSTMDKKERTAYSNSGWLLMGEDEDDDNNNE
jgi:hypothetical protein